MDLNKINAALRQVCSTQFGVVDTHFLCQPVSVLHPKLPLCVLEDTTVNEAVNRLRDNKIGAVLVVTRQGLLKGIFSERDCVTRVWGNGAENVGAVMTKEPHTIQMQTPIAFALTLMSQGGFRHLPVVDDTNVPIGILSVKNMVDHIVKAVVDDLLSFETSELS